MGWYTILLAVCVIGLGLIVFSRHERQQAASNASTTTTTTQANTTPPLLTDHWQVALSVDVCGQVQNLPRSANQSSGIITTGNGVVDIEPARAGTKAAQFEGAKATLAKFLTSEDVGLTASKLTLPKSLGKLAGTYGASRKCGTKPGRVQLLIWSSPSATDAVRGPEPRRDRLRQRRDVHGGFRPEGGHGRPAAGAEAGRGVPHVSDHDDYDQAGQAPRRRTKPGGTTTTTKPGGTTTTTKPGGTTTTTKPAGTTTTTG